MHPLFILLLFESLSSVRGILNAESHHQKLVLPARQSCKDKSAYIDFAVKRCVLIDRLQRCMPTFAPCPVNTLLEGRHCVGLVTTECELGCAHKYLLNDDGVCVRVEAYQPPRVVCPPDYILTRRRVGDERTCIKKIYSEPTYESIECAECSGIELHCPQGFRVLRRDDGNKNNDAEDLREDLQPPRKERKKTKNRTFDETTANDNEKGFRKLKQRQKQPLCVSDNIVAPSSQDTCSTHFHWSLKIGGCLMLEAVDPLPQCPKPDAKVGLGRGDWETPDFVYDAVSQQCIASSSPARYPRCPPGWALEGLFKPYCYKKIYSPITYDCDNAEGFKFRWDAERHIGLCEFEFDATEFAPGPSYLSRRSRTDAAILRLGNTPWDVLEGSEAGVQYVERAQRREPVEGDHGRDESLVVYGAGTMASQLASDALIDQDLLSTDSSGYMFFPSQFGATGSTFDSASLVPYAPKVFTSNKPGPSGVKAPDHRSPFGGRSRFGAFSVHNRLF